MSDAELPAFAQLAEEHPDAEILVAFWGMIAVRAGREGEP
jgi:hypothetical protein